MVVHLSREGFAKVSLCSTSCVCTNITKPAPAPACLYDNHLVRETHCQDSAAMNTGKDAGARVLLTSGFMASNTLNLKD